MYLYCYLYRILIRECLKPEIITTACCRDRHWCVDSNFYQKKTKSHDKYYYKCSEGVVVVVVPQNNVVR